MALPSTTGQLAMWQPDRAPQILPCKRERSIGLGVPRIIFILVEKYLLVAIFHLAQPILLRRSARRCTAHRLWLRRTESH